MTQTTTIRLAQQKHYTLGPQQLLNIWAQQLSADPWAVGVLDQTELDAASLP